jgi:hypothetical protein
MEHCLAQEVTQHENPVDRPCSNKGRHAIRQHTHSSAEQEILLERRAAGSDDQKGQLLNSDTRVAWYCLYAGHKVVAPTK